MPVWPLARDRVGDYRPLTTMLQPDQMLTPAPHPVLGHWQDADPFAADLGCRLRAARLAAGLSVRGLSDRMRALDSVRAPSTLMRIERGALELRVRVLCHWAQACGMAPWDVLRLPPVAAQGSGGSTSRKPLLRG